MPARALATVDEALELLRSLGAQVGSGQSEQRVVVVTAGELGPDAPAAGSSAPGRGAGDRAAAEGALGVRDLALGDVEMVSFAPGQQAFLAVAPPADGEAPPAYGQWFSFPSLAPLGAARQPWPVAEAHAASCSRRPPARPCERGGTFEGTRRCRELELGL